MKSTHDIPLNSNKKSLINEESNEGFLFPPANKPEDSFAEASVLVATGTQDKKDETLDEYS